MRCKEICSCCNCLKKRKSETGELGDAFNRLKRDPVVESQISQLDELETSYTDKKNIFFHAVNVMQNFIGNPAYPFLTHQKQLYPYILFLCEGFKDEDFRIMKEEIPKNDIKIQLFVIIKEGKIIHPRHTEFSRVYCKLWIQEGKNYVTSVKDSSSELLWHEAFVLDVNNCSLDCLHMQVWSSRRGLIEKLSKPSPEVTKENDPLHNHIGDYLIGEVNQEIKYLPCVAQDVLWTVKKGPRKVYTRGQVNVFIQLISKRRKDHAVHIHIHMALLRQCYEKQQLHFQEHSFGLWKNWLEILPNAALTLIHQHAIQHAMTSSELSGCSWIVASSLKSRGEGRISFYFLKFLLEALLISMIDDPLEKDLEKALNNSMLNFFEYTVNALKDLHGKFDVQSIDMASELYYMLKCMHFLEEKSGFTYLDAYKILQEEAMEWYLSIIANYRQDLEDNEGLILDVSEILKQILITFLKNQIILDDIFLRAWSLSYSKIIFDELDYVVCEVIKPIIMHLVTAMLNSKQHQRKMESLKMLDLYHNVRILVNYVMSKLPVERSYLSMEGYSEWFEESVIFDWFLLCRIYTSPFVKHLVLTDNMERKDENSYDGSSAAGVTSIIDEMVTDLWLKLKWEDQCCSHESLTNAMMSCVLDYMQVVLEKITAKHFFGEESVFKINQKLCVALSSVYAVYEHLHDTNEKIKEVLKSLDSTDEFPVIKPMIVVENDLQIAVSYIFLSVLKQFDEKLRKLVKEMVRSCTDVSKSPATADLCNYIDESIEILYLNMKWEPFYICLKYMWLIAVTNLKDGLRYRRNLWLMCKRKQSIHILTLQVLKQLHVIFYSEGSGLSLYDMTNEVFM
ncbi:BAI1-associated protein 3-like, partial [Stegodyphus dumicola]|uniref:BAI1-associated protein 3-like n=1 Tax=Stegodyphus dumicola TaxID=202533 RepID=UPI0015A76425